MARKTVLVSDMTGKEIEAGKGATLRISFSDARRGNYEADVTADEAQALIKDTKARSVARRGRRPKATTS